MRASISESRTLYDPHQGLGPLWNFFSSAKWKQEIGDSELGHGGEGFITIDTPESKAGRGVFKVNLELRQSLSHKSEQRGL